MRLVFRLIDWLTKFHESFNYIVLSVYFLISIYIFLIWLPLSFKLVVFHPLSMEPWAAAKKVFKLVWLFET